MTNPPASWHAVYPAPRQASPATIQREVVLEMLHSNTDAVGKDYILVDLRRNDHEVSSCSSALLVIRDSLL
jgi:arsenical-resistance protein 2